MGPSRSSISRRVTWSQGWRHSRTAATTRTASCCCRSGTTSPGTDPIATGGEVGRPCLPRGIPMDTRHRGRASRQDTPEILRWAGAIAWRLLVAGSILLLAHPEPAAAHGLGQRYELPVPLALYLTGAGL